MSSSPSIGNVGIDVDKRNKRVKILMQYKFYHVNDFIDCTADLINSTPEAEVLLQQGSARLSIRVVVPSEMPLKRFYLSRMAVREEARIRTPYGFDLVYVGGNTHGRRNETERQIERSLASNACLRSLPIHKPRGVTYHKLSYPIPAGDIEQLLEMYELCFMSYPFDLNEEFLQSATEKSIFVVARNQDEIIIASAIGESLQVGKLTLLELSEQASHPLRRIPGAASYCSSTVVKIAKNELPPPLVIYSESRMWDKALVMAPRIGLKGFAGILHQHCRISSPPELTTLQNHGSYGSLAVFYTC